MSPLPMMLKTDPLPAKSPSDGFTSGVYEENIDLSTKK